MSARLLILCPGQGGQHAAMFDLARTDARAARMLEQCALPAAPDAMFENRVAQPSIVAATLAMWEAIGASSPALVAGYSVGELSAYAVAGSLAPLDAVALARVRAQLMDQAVSEPQTMAAVSAVAWRRVREPIAAAGFEIAIVTGHDSCIAGGLAAALPALEQAVRSLGGRVQRLPVALASHTSLMAAAVGPFEAALRGAPFGAPAVPVLSGIAAATITERERAISTLARQLCETIRWSDCMDAAAEAGVTVALELGPGAALSRMLRSRHPGIACRSVEDFRSLDGIRAWLARELAR